MTNFHFTKNPFFSDELLDACNKDLAEYENSIRADERRKFAEWCKSKGYSCYDWRMLIEQYEKESNNA